METPKTSGRTWSTLSWGGSDATRRHTLASVITGRLGIFTRDLDDTKESGHWLLSSRVFNYTINGVIILSAIEMGLAAGDDKSSMASFWLFCEHAFTAFFAWEMVVKLWFLGRLYFTDRSHGNWNILDFIVVWVSVVDMWVLSLLHGADVDFGFVRILRLLRVMRLLKLAHQIPELNVVVEGMVASLRAMVWILMLLGLVLYSYSIASVEIIGSEKELYPAYDQEAQNDDGVSSFNNYFYFGTVLRAMQTLLSIILLTEWDQITRPICATQPEMIFLFVSLVAISTLGIFNVIIGVIVERTMKAMLDARELSNDEVRERRSSLVHELADIMFEIDANGDGFLSSREMEDANNNEHLLSILHGIELPQGFTLPNLHQMLDIRGKGELSKSDFILGLLRLIQHDGFSSVCLQQLFFGQIKSQVHSLQEELRRELAAIRADLAGRAGSKRLGSGGERERTDCRELPPSERSRVPESSSSHVAGSLHGAVVPSKQMLEGLGSATAVLIDAVLQLEAPLSECMSLASACGLHCSSGSTAGGSLHCPTEVAQPPGLRSPVAAPGRLLDISPKPFELLADFRVTSAHTIPSDELQAHEQGLDRAPFSSIAFMAKASRRDAPAAPRVV